MNLAYVVNLLDKYKIRATYGAVAGILGTIPRSVMVGLPRVPRNSWVVNRNTGQPTGYINSLLHPNLLTRNTILDTPAALQAFLNNPF